MLTLQQFLAAVLGGTLVLGPIVFALVEKYNLFSTLDVGSKRLAVAGLTGVLGVLAWYASVLLGYAPMPVGSTDVAEAIWANGINMAIAAFGSSTLLHGFFVGNAPPSDLPTPDELAG